MSVELQFWCSSFSCEPFILDECILSEKLIVNPKTAEHVFNSASSIDISNLGSTLWSFGYSFHTLINVNKFVHRLNVAGYAFWIIIEQNVSGCVILKQIYCYSSQSGSLFPHPTHDDDRITILTFNRPLRKDVYDSTSIGL